MSQPPEPPFSRRSHPEDRPPQGQSAPGHGYAPQPDPHELYRPARRNPAQDQQPEWGSAPQHHPQDLAYDPGYGAVPQGGTPEPGHWAAQQYRPDGHEDHRYYEPSDMGDDVSDWTPGAGPAQDEPAGGVE